MTRLHREGASARGLPQFSLKARPEQPPATKRACSCAGAPVQAFRERADAIRASKMKVLVRRGEPQTACQPPTCVRTAATRVQAPI